MERRLPLSLLLSLPFSLLLPVALHAQDTRPIMQGFYWNTHPGDITDTGQGVWWDSLAAVAGELAGAGFSTIWTPPAQKGFAGIYDMGYGLYDYFDLGSYDQKGTVRTRHGSRAQLDAMIAAYHGAGLKVMADVVLNHRAGADGQQPDACGGQELRYTEFRPASGLLLGDAPDFHPNATHCDLNAPYHDRTFFEDICYFSFIDNVLDPGAPNGGWYHGPHNLGRMGDELIKWGRWLRDDVGFDEIRLDAVKHIEPGFLAPFLVELSSGAQPFAVGEFFDGNAGAVAFYQKDVERFVSTYGTGSKNADMAIFDFPLRYALRDMANNTGGGFDMWFLSTSGLALNGNPNDRLAAEDVVTFVENHDTDRYGYEVAACGPGTIPYGATCLRIAAADGHDPVVHDKHMAYAYLMAAPGRPTVFWKDWYWYGLDEEIGWQMTLRRATATGGAAHIQDLNPFFTSLHGGDLHVLTRAGSGSGRDGLVFTINDNPGSQAAAYVDTPYNDLELRDYSDAFLFVSTRAFGDSRALVRANPRNYAWYAPTGLYPQAPGEPASAFTLGSHAGAKLHYVVLRAADAASFLVNGAPIQPGDEIAVLHPSTGEAVGLGRIGQRLRWDGVHDMIVEVLGGASPAEARGALLDGTPLRLAVYDQSTGAMLESFTVTFAPFGTSFTFSADRPASRGGSAPFNLATTHGGAGYQTGAISLVTAFETETLPNQPPVADAGDDQTVECTGGGVTLDGSGSSDADGDALTYTWREGGDVLAGPSQDATALVQLAAGTHVIELTVDDGNGGTATDEVEVTVEDATPPVVTLAGDAEVVLECGVDTFTDPGATAVDACDGPLAVTVSGAVDASTPGTYVLTYTATDAAGNTGEAERTVVVGDTQPPVLSVTGPTATLWPPNHAYHSIPLSAFSASASDACAAGLSDVVFAGASSDEPEDGDDDGSTLNDIVFGAGCSTVQVRAERDGQGDGRAYTLTLAVADPSGNVGTATILAAQVPVSKKSTVTAGPAVYSVPGCLPAPSARLAAQGGALDAALDATMRSGEAASLSAGGDVPEAFALGQNYPNPFNPQTVIAYDVAEAVHVRLAVYDALGRLVEVLVDETRSPGRHAATFDASALPSGLYVYRIEMGPYRAAGRMVVVK